MILQTFLLRYKLTMLIVVNKETGKVPVEL